MSRTVNVTIVHCNASVTTFQVANFREACREVACMTKDPYYRIDLSNRVFVADAENRAGQPAMYTVGEMAREIGPIA